MSVRWRYFFLGADLQWTIGPCVDPSDDQRGCLEFCDAGAGCLLARKQTMCLHLPYSSNAYSQQVVRDGDSHGSC